VLLGRDEAVKISLGLGGDEIAVSLWRKLIDTKNQGLHDKIAKTYVVITKLLSLL
jgi:uncharacterized RDD family membrane protein YckC